LNYFDDSFSVSLDETHTAENIQALLSIFGKEDVKKGDWNQEKCPLSKDLHRSDKILEHEVFNSYHSETKMMRYQKSLENKDLSLVHSMISLGSCTMKLNAAAELMPLSWPVFANIHPFAPKAQWK